MRRPRRGGDSSTPDPATNREVSYHERRASRHASGVGVILLVVGLAAALSVDVVKTGFGIKGDEATYVASGLSAAFDGDLTYERKDLERFFGLYRAGPEGIFLKRGKLLRLQPRRHAAVRAFRETVDTRADRLFFAKALIYGVVSSALRAPARPERLSRAARPPAVRRPAPAATRSRRPFESRAGAGLRARLRAGELRAQVCGVPDAGNPELCPRLRGVFPVALTKKWRRMAARDFLAAAAAI